MDLLVPFEGRVSLMTPEPETFSWSSAVVCEWSSDERLQHPEWYRSRSRPGGCSPHQQESLWWDQISESGGKRHVWSRALPESVLWCWFVTFCVLSKGACVDCFFPRSNVCPNNTSPDVRISINLSLITNKRQNYKTVKEKWVSMQTTCCSIEKMKTDVLFWSFVLRDV